MALVVFVFAAIIMLAGRLMSALLFALGMGFAGGVLPAIRAARMNLVESLRAV